MNTRERQVEKLKDYLLAAAISLGFVWVLVDGLTH
jgi:hypothetical protein